MSAPREAITLEWEPLSHSGSELVIADRLGEQGILRLPTMGTCGNPTSDIYIPWRENEFGPIAATYGVGDKVWSPVVEEWDPSMAYVESIMAARSKVVAINIENTLSPASDLEAGLITYGAILRGGQEVGLRLNPSDHVSRRIARAALQATAQAYPLFHEFTSVEQLATHTSFALRTKIQQKEAGVRTETIHRLPRARTDLRPSIYLAGTSGSSRPQWLDEITNTVRDFDRHRAGDTPIQDSHRTNWTEADIAPELDHKFNDAVQLIAITKETESLGAMAELGWRLLHGHLAGQSIGVYLEMHDSAPNSDANRPRVLFLEHMARLREDFPDLPVYVAPNLFDLALFGASELRRQEQRLDQRISS